MDVQKRLRQKLIRQKYHLVGDHSAVKICTWTRKALTGKGYCYKQQFYGIRSHLCCQISPSVGYCQNACIFCWREIEDTLGTAMEGLTEIDAPEAIIEGSILGQRKLISGYGGHPSINREMLEEAQEPMHFAISLTGEPTLYPRLGELIEGLHQRGKTTFLVSNGLLPEVLSGIPMPTQLYLSVDAPNAELFRKIDRSCLPDAWERLQKSLSVMKERNVETRTSLRFTIIKGINDTDPEGWADAIRASEPLFVEVKAYMFVGSSRMRLSIKNMPLHEEILSFSEEICRHSGYRIIDQKKESRVVLLMKEDTPDRLMKF